MIISLIDGTQVEIKYFESRSPIENLNLINSSIWIYIFQEAKWFRWYDDKYLNSAVSYIEGQTYEELIEKLLDLREKVIDTTINNYEY